MSSSVKIRKTVAHSIASWLPQTMTWIYPQVKYLSGFSSMVITNTTQNLDQFPWEPIYTLKSKYQSFTYKMLTKLRIKTYSNSFDSEISSHRTVIIHSHFADRGWQDLEIARRHKLKHVVTFYGYDVNMLPSQNQEWIERYKRLFYAADLFLCEGPYMANCIEKLGCPREKIAIQRLGIETENIPLLSRRLEPGGQVKILIAGTFREKKGIPYALEAVGMLIEDYPNVKVTIVGDSTGKEREESEKAKINEVINRYNLGSVVNILGFQPYVALKALAYQHHFFLSPSLTASDGDMEGGAPVTIIEMAASGMPVISTNHCDIPFVLGPMNRGLLVPERDSIALKNKMLELIHMTESERLELIKNNRDYIESELDITLCIAELSNKYHSLLS